MTKTTLKASTMSPPPSYRLKSPQSRLVTRLVSYLFYRGPYVIKATDVPQWEWSNRQCREWLRAVFEAKYHWDKDTAFLSAERWEGFGPRLYLMTCREWESFLGHERGLSIYSLLVGLKHKRGAVPRGLVLNRPAVVKAGTTSKRSLG
ncbi:hypothetical protein VTL71DRAFT_8783 [Oculimacula yallundae]|uniref:Uncharacterized protein n=1 Tax=Oculimacula yallundae TaxID=86028 RepID=A0ABR4CYK3_9HELO